MGVWVHDQGVTGTMADVASGSRWGITPRQSIAAACAKRGSEAVVSGCVAILGGDLRDTELVVALGGPSAELLLSGGSRADLATWTRVWATRGLLWAADPTATTATPALATALTDESWRVRELAAKVVARHRLDDLLGSVLALRDDPIPRVRAAAHRAVVALTR